MQIIELTAKITDQHEIHLKLPEKINSDSVKRVITITDAKNKSNIYGKVSFL